MPYIRNHWQGKHALVYALFVNLILVRMVVLFAERYTLPPFIPDRADALIATVIFILIFHGPVFVWQVVGVLRATRHQNSSLAGIWTVATYGAVGLCLVFTVLGIANAYRALDPARFVIVNPLALQQERERQYALTLGPDGTRIHISGIFTLGMSERLAALLDQHPTVTGIVLNSEGGHIYEGRGVAYLIRDRGLDTYVLDRCNSACTTAFMGGKQRFLGPDAVLGFHQYRVDLRYPTPIYDLEGEQEKEIRFYRQQGLSEDFLARVFLAPHSGIWYPTTPELIEAGVITRTLSPAEAAQ
ncbi:hypothetical protein LPB41_28720 [Thalassospira sp. MA62]|nr:hypothetical protein [Thalassospira sp. MA62]